jgi:hypothetical protein
MKSRMLIPIALFTCCAAHAADLQTADAAAPHAMAEQRLRQDMQILLSQMAVSGALGEHPEDVRVSLQQPAQRVTDLGVLVDSTSAERARNGLRVLGTTPGGTGERLGLRPGDVLVAVNGTSLRNLGADADGRALAATTLKSAVDALPDATPLQLDVERAGNVLAMNAPVHSVLLPALSVELGAATLAAATDNANVAGGSCGRISSFDVAPRGEQQYHAVILQIDGATPGPNARGTYRVSAGEHKLLVAEDIPTEFMGAGPLATVRTRMHTHKELTVNVKPNTTAMIAAQLHVDKNTEFQHGLYWDPVMWREIPESCP